MLLVLVGAWAVARTGVARSVLGSPQALLILTGAGLLAVLIGVGVWRLTRRPLLSRGLALVPVLAIFGWSEVLPMLSDPVVRADADPLAAVSTLAPTAPPVTTSPTTAPPTSAPPTAAPPTTAPPTTAPPATPVLLGSDALVGIDHAAGGTAQLIRSAAGTLVVRLAEFFVEPGPDYLLYVVPATGATTPDGGTSLGEFDVTTGSVNLDLPATFDASGAVTVLIWCRAYAVPVAHATVVG